MIEISEAAKRAARFEINFRGSMQYALGFYTQKAIDEETAALKAHINRLENALAEAQKAEK